VCPIVLARAVNCVRTDSGPAAERLRLRRSGETLKCRRWWTVHQVTGDQISALVRPQDRRIDLEVIDSRRVNRLMPQLHRICADPACGERADIAQRRSTKFRRPNSWRTAGDPYVDPLLASQRPTN
jgi:hypothetical protein